MVISERFMVISWHFIVISERFMVISWHFMVISERFMVISWHFMVISERFMVNSWHFMGVSYILSNNIVIWVCPKNELYTLHIWPFYIKFVGTLLSDRPILSVSVTPSVFFGHKQQDSWNRHGKSPFFFWKKYGHFYMAVFKLLELEKDNCMNYMTTIFLEIKTCFKLKCLSTCWRRALNCLAWTSRQVSPSFIHQFSSWNGPIRFSVFCLRSRHGVHENPTEGNRYKMAPPTYKLEPPWSIFIYHMSHKSI